MGFSWAPRPESETLGPREVAPLPTRTEESSYLILHHQKSRELQAWVSRLKCRELRENRRNTRPRAQESITIDKTACYAHTPQGASRPHPAGAQRGQQGGGCAERALWAVSSEGAGRPGKQAGTAGLSHFRRPGVDASRWPAAGRPRAQERQEGGAWGFGAPVGGGVRSHIPGRTTPPEAGDTKRQGPGHRGLPSAPARGRVSGSCKADPAGRGRGGGARRGGRVSQAHEVGLRRAL